VKEATDLEQLHAGLESADLLEHLELVGLGDGSELHVENHLLLLLLLGLLGGRGGGGSGRSGASTGSLDDNAATHEGAIGHVEPQLEELHQLEHLDLVELEQSLADLPHARGEVELLPIGHVLPLLGGGEIGDVGVECLVLAEFGEGHGLQREGHSRLVIGGLGGSGRSALASLRRGGVLICSARQNDAIATFRKN
jgi:hypothetical protein